MSVLIFVTLNKGAHHVAFNLFTYCCSWNAV